MRVAGNGVGNILRFMNIEENMSGEYTCVIISNVTQATASVSVQVIVESKSRNLCYASVILFHKCMPRTCTAKFVQRQKPQLHMNKQQRNLDTLNIKHPNDVLAKISQ